MAAPQPSSTYGQTVCVAGVTLDAQPRWLRLYPVPFDYLDGAQRFRKYDIVEVAVRSAGADQRPESRKINAESLRIVDRLPDWPSRSRWVEPLAVSSMCEMVRNVRGDPNAPSLGAIRPRRVAGLVLEPHPGWTGEQVARFDRFARQHSLFGEPPGLPDPPRFRGRFLYLCADNGCTRHEQSILDWEFSTRQDLHRAASDRSLRTVLWRDFYTNVFERRTAPLLFVGNQENPARRHVFSVLGTYYPKAGTAAPGEVLF